MDFIEIHMAFLKDVQPEEARKEPFYTAVSGIPHFFKTPDPPKGTHERKAEGSRAALYRIAELGQA